MSGGPARVTAADTIRGASQNCPPGSKAEDGVGEAGEVNYLPTLLFWPLFAKTFPLLHSDPGKNDRVMVFRTPVEGSQTVSPLFIFECFHLKQKAERKHRR